MGNAVTDKQKIRVMCYNVMINMDDATVMDLFVKTARRCTEVLQLN
jgi:hypothetical protein